VPMKLSALTKALLSDGAPAAVAAAEQPHALPKTRRRSALSASVSAANERGRHLRSGSVQAYEAKSSRPNSPIKSRETSPVRKRVVRLSNTPKSLNQIDRRPTSVSRSTQRATKPPSRPPSRDKSADEKQLPAQDVNTPGQGVRVVRIAGGSSGPKGRSTGSSAVSSAQRSGSRLERDQSDDPGTVARNVVVVSQGSVSRNPSNAGRNRQDENPALQSSMRIKRVGKVPGSFLSGPARRGRRRQSEEDGDGNGDGEPIYSSQEQESQAQDQGEPPASSFYGNGYDDYAASGSPVSSKDPSRAVHRRLLSNAGPEPGSASSRPSPPEVAQEPEEIPYKLPTSRPAVPVVTGQENEPISSFKRPKPAAGDLVDLDKMPKRPLSIGIGGSLRQASPERKPLAAMSHNTPHRPAPPPPKMSVLETATATAGAATTTQAKQRRNILKVNNKPFTRLECLGRGGSAKVYKVTAENGALFALKRVALENADENMIRGYRGEIDLLTKLEKSNRVINLYDYELNQEKKVLTLVSFVP
jgi:serine/threonine-protein kinase TTK/MPS1